ncbi:MAG: hypothetical protein F2958_02120 [Actinobacteria bacterium]|nr:hypothetical protein [Actinomycetota bacterium]
MTAPHDRPSAVELLEAVREWMEKDLMSGIEPRLQFHTRVAMNVLDIVSREIAMGADQLQSHAELLASFGVESDAELSQQIRSGDHDNGLLEVLERLRPVIEDKVRVANPKYLR